LNIANAIWAQQGAAFEKPFLDDAQRYFDAEVGQLDFASPQAVKTVNSWVNQKTSGMIPTLVQEFPPATMMVLVNAVYFKGKWQTPFEPSSTQEQDFHLPDGKTKRLPMMYQGGKFQYFVEGKDNKQLEAVALPYNDGRLNLYLFLPAPKQSLDSLISQFNTENWQRWTKQFSKQAGSISLPRFKMSYATQLGEPLQKLGVKQLFQLGKADLSGIRKSNDLFISQVIHKTVMEVNEEGTKAAAVTGAMATGGAAPVGPPPFQFIADRPFLVVLHDSQTDAILFIGGVRSPETL
jgi:serpin B